MKKYLLLLFAVGMIAIGCNKEEDPPADTTYDATITITSPAEGAMGMVGQELEIEAEIDRPDNKIIHNVSVIIEDTDGNVIDKLVDDAHVHAEGHHHIHEHFHPDAHGEYVLRVMSHDHDDHNKMVEATRNFMVMMASYDVTVDIQEPVENTVLAVNDDLDVKVVYTHPDGGKIHHVMIEIQDNDGNVVATLDQGHKHVDGTYTFEQAAAYTATATGTFKVVARTMNHDMSIMQMAERTFTVQ